MQTGEPPENYYPTPTRGIEWVKNEDIWEVMIAVGKVQFTLLIYNTKTPEEMLEKLKTTLKELNVEPTDYQYRRRTYPQAILMQPFESLYQLCVEPNKIELMVLWESGANKDSATKLMMKDIVPFHTLTHELQYAFYVCCVNRKLIKPIEQTKPQAISAIFDTAYDQTVTPNLQKLAEIWDDESINTVELFGEYRNFYTKVSKQIQYAFYCWCIDQKLLEA